MAGAEEQGGREKIPVRPFGVSALDSLLLASSRAYDAMVARLAATLPRGVHRSLRKADENLLFSPDTLMKADGAAGEAGQGPGAAVGMAQEPQAMDPSVPGVKRNVVPYYDPVEQRYVYAGLHGGKFYIDDRGHVVWGERPTKRFHKEASPEAVAKYLQDFAPASFLFGYSKKFLDTCKSQGIISDTDRKFVDDYRKQLAWLFSAEDTTGDPDQIVLRGSKGSSKTIGRSQFDDMSTEEQEKLLKDIYSRYPDTLEGEVLKLFRTMTNFGNVSDTEKVRLVNGWNGLNKALQKAKKDPQFARYFLANEEDHMRALGVMVATMNDVSSQCDQVFKNVMGDGFDEYGSALTVLAASNSLHPDQGYYFPVRSKKSITKDSEDSEEAVRRLMGNVEPNSSLVNFVDGSDAYDRMTAAQKTLHKMASHICDHGLEETRTYFPSSVFDEELRTSFNVERKAAGQQELTPGEWKNIADKLSLTGKRLSKILDDHNNGYDIVVDKIMEKDPGYYGAVLSGNVQSVVDRVKAREARMKASLAAQNNADLTLPETWNSQYSAPAFQFKYANWAIETMAGLIGAGTGLGKTAIMCMIHSVLQNRGAIKRSLFFVPSKMLSQWAAEANKFVPGAKVITSENKTIQQTSAIMDAINRGETQCDMLILSAGILRPVIANEAQRRQAIKDARIRGDYMEAEFIETAEGIPEAIEALRKMDGAVFVDEAHTHGLRSGNKSFDAMKSILYERGDEDSPKPPRNYRYMVTATAMRNAPGDLFDLLSLADPDSVGTDKIRFVAKSQVAYQDPKTGEYRYVGLKAAAPILKNIAPFMLCKQRSDPDVKQDIHNYNIAAAKYNADLDALGDKNTPRRPPIKENADYTVDVVPLSASKEERDFYAKVDAGEVQYPQGEEPGKPTWVYKNDQDVRDKVPDVQVAGLVIATLHRMAKEMGLLHPKLIDKSYTGRSTKLDAVVRDVLDHLRNEDNYKKDAKGADKLKVPIVSSAHPAVFDLLKKELITHGVPPNCIGEITGKVSAKDTARAIDMANQGKLAVLLLGVGAGGAGLNLQKASNTMFNLDRTWSMGQQAQLYARVDRIGQEDPVTFRHYDIVDVPEAAHDDKQTSSLLTKLAMGAYLTSEDEAKAVRYLSAMSEKFAGRKQTLEGLQYKPLADNYTPEQLVDIQSKFREATVGLREVPEFKDLEQASESYTQTLDRIKTADPGFADTMERMYKEMDAQGVYVQQVERAALLARLDGDVASAKGMYLTYGLGRSLDVTAPPVLQAMRIRSYVAATGEMPPRDNRGVALDSFFAKHPHLNPIKSEEYLAYRNKVVQEYNRRNPEQLREPAGAAHKEPDAGTGEKTE